MEIAVSAEQRSSTNAILVQGPDSSNSNIAVGQTSGTLEFAVSAEPRASTTTTIDPGPGTTDNFVEQRNGTF